MATRDIDFMALSKAKSEALIAEGWTPPPQVYLEGDEIPCHLPVIDNHGEVRDDYQDYSQDDGEVYTANYNVVHMNIDYDTAVARERAKRGLPAPKHYSAKED